MTREELLSNRTDEPVLTDEQFAEAIRLAIAELKAERIIRRKAKRGRGRSAKSRDLSDAAGTFLSGADEMLSVLGG